MYELPGNPEVYLKQQLNKGFPLSEMTICRKCCLISEQQETIRFLNDQIYKLSASVQRLRDIRSMEKEIDESHNTNAYNTVNEYPIAGALCQQTVVQAVSSAVGIPKDLPLNKHANQSKGGEQCNSIDKEMENIRQQFSQLQISSDGTRTVEEAPPENVPSVVEEVHNANDGDVETLNHYHRDGCNGINTEDGFSEEDIINISSDSEIFGASVTDDTSMVVGISKFQPNNSVETVFVGDSIIGKLHIAEEEVHPERVFKIARPGADIKELAEDVEFFIDRLYNKATKLVFQLGYQDFRAGKSEIIKKDILQLLNGMAQRGIEVTLSGPIPYPAMTSVSFSRMSAIHRWLKCTLPKDVIYINNFDIFQEDPGLFTENGFTLNDSGNITLSGNIAASAD